MIQISSLGRRPFAAMIGVLSGCVTDGQDAPERVYEALAPFRAIPGLTSAGLAVGSISDADVAPGARVVVLDGFTHRWMAVDTLGVVTGSSGKKGSGPGEIDQGVAVSVSDGGEVAVGDPGNQRVAIWSADGRHSRDVRYTDGIITDVVWTGGRLFVRSLIRNASAFVAVDTSPAGDRGRSTAHVLCSHCPAAVAPSGDVAAALPDTQYRFALYSNGQQSIVQPPHTPLAAVAISVAELEAGQRQMQQVAGDVRSRGLPIDEARLLALASARRFKPRIAAGGIAFDGQGNLWVTVATESRHETFFDVFDSQGTLIRRFRAQPALELLAVGRGLIVGKSLDASGEPQLLFTQQPRLH